MTHCRCLIQWKYFPYIFLHNNSHPLPQPVEEADQYGPEFVYEIVWRELDGEEGEDGHPEEEEEQEEDSNVWEKKIVTSWEEVGGGVLVRPCLVPSDLCSSQALFETFGPMLGLVWYNQTYICTS